MPRSIITHHKTKEEAEKARETFKENYGGFPYEGSASVYPRDKDNPNTIWVCDATHWGSG